LAHRLLLPLTLLVAVLVALPFLVGTRPAAAPVVSAAAARPPVEAPAPQEPDHGLTLTRVEDPAGTEVTDAEGAWVASFTDAASTVVLAGPERNFDEPTADHAVTTTDWVRVLPAPFGGEVDVDWLLDAIEDRTPDVLEVSTQYFAGAPDVFDEDGVLVSADAAYGPLQPDGSRPVGSDWHDFRGVDASYGGKVDPADPDEFRSLDCSGYTRTVFGARFGVPMSLRPDGGTSFPRRSFEQAADAPGIVPITDGVVDADQLRAGDLVFFDSPEDDDDRIDHVGIYFGVDEAGHHRFAHSRRSANGPTLGGDAEGASILDGDSYWARGFVSTRRL
jgi:hypothetical protein